MSLRDCPTSLDLTTDAGRAAAFNATLSADLDLGDNGEIDIAAVHYMAHWTHRVDQDTGEERAFSRLVLIDGMGKTFATTSLVVPHLLAAACDLFGKPPWTPPLWLRIRQRKTKDRARSYHELRVLGRRPPEEVAGG